MKKYFLIMISLVMLSCSKDDEEKKVLNTDKSEIVLSSTNKQDTFNITCNEDWTIKASSLSYGLGTKKAEGKFYILSEGMGEGNTTIKIELKDGFKGVSEEILTIKSLNRKITILIKKK